MFRKIFGAVTFMIKVMANASRIEIHGLRVATRKRARFG